MYRNSLNVFNMNSTEYYIKLKQVEYPNSLSTINLFEFPIFSLTEKELSCACVFTCFMAVTVITKKRGRPLVTGEVGVSIINCKDKHRDGEWRDFKKFKVQREKITIKTQTLSVCSLLETKQRNSKDNKENWWLQCQTGNAHNFLQR